jgi:hypothetical protein
MSPQYFTNDSIYNFDENLPIDRCCSNSSNTEFDYNDSVIYSLIESDESDFLNIDEESGQIFFNKSPDFEEKSVYDFEVSATDSYGLVEYTEYSIRNQ